MPEYRQFFGDAERAFNLTAPMIRELERKTGAGIGALTNRVVAREFFHDDIVEIIRLALIGGGTPQREAKTLVDTYAIGRPLYESHNLAIEILNALWAVPVEPEPVEQKGETNAEG